jgi:hypothetical protein
VYLPTTAPRVMVDELRQLGAVVVQHGGEYAEAYYAAFLFDVIITADLTAEQTTVLGELLHRDGEQARRLSGTP